MKRYFQLHEIEQDDDEDVDVNDSVFFGKTSLQHNMVDEYSQDDSSSLECATNWMQEASEQLINDEEDCEAEEDDDEAVSEKDESTPPSPVTQHLSHDDVMMTNENSLLTTPSSISSSDGLGTNAADDNPQLQEPPVDVVQSDSHS